MTCGIYCITNLINGKQYVGQSIHVEERFIQHIEKESNSEIHNAIVKYGVKNFKFEVIVSCSPEELDEQEVKFIRLLGTYENGYNQTRGGQHHVFNIEHNYEEYLKIKEQLKDKNKLINLLTKENKNLKERLELSKANEHRLLIFKEELENKIAKNELNINEDNIFYEALVEKRRFREGLNYGRI